MTTDLAKQGWLDRFSDRQMVMAVIAFALLLYVPFAGSYGLWDPWETHYGEVARQMTYRSDFISLWWPGSPRDPDVFWSKPVLTFWILSLAMHVAGIGLRGGAPSEMALGTRAEWAMRVPMAFAAAMALVGVYLVVSRFVNRRAAVLSTLVLATSPMFSLIARQAMTDMPFVGPMVLALSLAALALFDDQDEMLPRRGQGMLTYPAHRLFYITVGVFLLLVLPQLWVDSVQLKFRLALWGGKRLMVYGAVAMIPYYVGSLMFLFLAARARYKAPLYFYLAAMLCGLAVLAKGLAGLGLPIIVFVAYLAFTWNWKRLRRAQLLPAILVSILAVVLVAAPWHHAMIIRHGWEFWNELFGDNHWRRMVLGRHGDRGTFEYFLLQLGYALLPWLVLAPAALAALVGRRSPETTPVAQRRQGVYLLGAIWFVAAYGVVSLSMTKFHHYVLPALPGLAIVVGCFLDDVLRRKDVRTMRLTVLVGLPLLALVTYDLTKAPHNAELFLWLFNYDYVHSPVGRPWPSQLNFTTPIAVFCATFAVAALLLCWRRVQTAGLALLCLSSVLFTYFLLDVYMKGVTPYWTQKDPIGAYYATRRSPEERLVAYMMYWRGETFYTKNEIYEGPKEDRAVFDTGNADQDLQTWLDRHRGRRVFFIFERARQSRLVSLLPTEARGTFKVIHDQNNKFVMAHADI
ncbi:MAG: glycosyltransferase family 39 protein [Deltaproteobacteria bacterium]|nr:glycosyltransferase family 39 protein [Deltaproteobacteria bacterium]